MTPSPFGMLKDPLTLQVFPNPFSLYSTQVSLSEHTIPRPRLSRLWSLQSKTSRMASSLSSKNTPLAAGVSLNNTPRVMVRNSVRLIWPGVTLLHWPRSKQETVSPLRVGVHLASLSLQNARLAVLAGQVIQLLLLSTFMLRLSMEVSCSSVDYLAQLTDDSLQRISSSVALLTS